MGTEVIYWRECLQAACSSKNIEMVKYLYDMNETSMYWNECIHDACRSENMEILKFVVSVIQKKEGEGGKGRGRGRGRGQKDTINWNSGLFVACFYNSVEIIEYMISKGATDCVALMYTCCGVGNIKIVNIISDLLVKMEKTDLVPEWNEGMSGACAGGHIEIVKMMISKGATNWNEALSRAYKNTEIVKLMLEHGATRFDSCLEHACELGDLNLALLVVEKGATNWNGGFMSACEYGHIELVKLMLKCGDDSIKAKCVYKGLETNINGATCADIIRLLIGILISDKGSDKDSVDNFKCLEYLKIHNLNLYRLYCKYTGKKPENVDYIHILKKHPPYILMLGCRVRTDDTYINKCSLKRLPDELFALLDQY